MPKPTLANSRLPSLTLITLGFMLVCLLVGAAIVFNVVNDKVRSFQELSLRTAVETRARGVQTAFAASLYREWANLEILAKSLSATEPANIQDDLSTLVGTGQIISWAGYAGSDGRVQVASNGLLKGEDVSTRPWFQQGLQGDFAGDAHEAVLLASKLPALENGEPLRFLDMAKPIAGADQTVVGVLGLHLNLEWAKTYVEELSNALNVGVSIVNPEGTAVISSEEQSILNLDLPSLGRARTGATGVSLEVWPDGKNYFVATLPEASYRTLPKFGWSIVARIDANAISEPASSFSSQLLFNLAMLCLFLLALTSLFIISFIRPFHHLANSAKAVADGEDVYPYESYRTSELATIGSAISRMQANMDRPDDTDKAKQPMDGQDGR
ncbi:cache and HAMP domain-containing protein [Agrobacterium sp. SORGH_AS 787]|uniref:HAMP domain-containing protein n=1 Tax=Agrobacterium sp. SORGH_AS 787 TaxID=3041775 RepID=UPI0027875FF6|nr:hypothetical protein [Rhizobium sp. SORGH_AS_0787]